MDKQFCGWKCLHTIPRVGFGAGGATVITNQHKTDFSIADAPVTAWSYLKAVSHSRYVLIIIPQLPQHTLNSLFMDDNAPTVTAGL